MNLNQDIFSIKLSEMEKQYKEVQNQIQLCEEKNQEEIRKELQRALNDYHLRSMMLQKSIKKQPFSGCKKAFVYSFRVQQ